MSVLSIGELLDMGGSASTTGLIPYSALEYNASGAIFGISGSAVVGADVSSKMDASASGQFAPSGDYVYQSAYSSFTGSITNNVTDISSVVSGKQDELTFGYSGSYISSINGSAIYDTTGGGGGGDYSGITPITVDNTARTIGTESVQFVLHSSLTGVLNNSQYTLGVNSAVYTPVQIVSSSSLATASGIVYVVI